MIRCWLVHFSGSTRRGLALRTAVCRSSTTVTLDRSSFSGTNRFGNLGVRHYFSDKSDDDDKKQKDDKREDDEDEDDDANGERSTSSATTTIIVPTKLPFGDATPRPPQLLALPLVSRPLFPGLVTSVTLTDEKTINALDELHTKGNSYLSCFLRAKHSSGVASDTGVVLSKPEVITDASDLYSTGTFAQIQRLTRSTTNDALYGGGLTATLILLAHRRVDLVNVNDVGPPIDVTVKHWPRMEYTAVASTSDSIRALSNEIISAIREVAQMNALFRENLQLFTMRIDANDPFRLADFAASISAAGTPEDLQAVLSESDPVLRLEKALTLLIREREVSKLQKEISAKVEEKLTEAQRKYFLMEQLKSIKKELGMERDDKDAILDKYRNKLNEYSNVPPEALDVIRAELDKFATLERNSAEYNVTRAYLDWLILFIPWGITSTDNFDLTQAKRILDSEHYGMEDVKNIILQYIAVGKLLHMQSPSQSTSTSTSSGKILCLAGPPGTGKTSIASSIAAALNRKFYRFSVGGLSDVSEIKGHRRTYIGSMPGKILQCLKSTGTLNPVCLIDEIDKLGTGYRGDPASALLEVLDPSQNSTYRDHYIDVPIDISKVLFICTANDTDNIPGPLRDRMEIVRLSGYDVPEKIAIAQQYLVPKALRDCGLMHEVATNNTTTDTTPSSDVVATPLDTVVTPLDTVVTRLDTVVTPLETLVRAENVPESLSITTQAITTLVRWYAREAGVRNLAKYITTIARKLALQIVAESEGTVLPDKVKRNSDTWVVDDNNLQDYVGMPIFTNNRLYETGLLPSGIVMGLAYTSMGGNHLYIETQGIYRGLDSDTGKPRGGGGFKATGQLGDVMKESTEIAYTVARARLAQIVENDKTISTNVASFFDVTDIHLHVPEGATPKDGPSAGITMVTSMLSLALNQPVRNDIAMTGEISLTGKVLPVGGIKEKIMAARRAGITQVIMPDANRRDYNEIPQYLKDGLTVHYADTYDKVYEVAFQSASDA